MKANLSEIVRTMVVVSSLVAPGFVGPRDVSAEQPVLVDVFESGKDGYHTFRIPALITAANGDLLAICEGRKTSRADHGDVDLVMRRSRDGGKTWSPLQLIYEEGGERKVTIGNPCPVLDRDTGVIFLPFTRENDDVFIMQTADHGATWSKPSKITDQVKRADWTWYATGPGNGIQLTEGARRGRLVIPCDHRIASIKDRRASTRSHAIYSDDHGKTWKIGGVTDFRMNECAVAELRNGDLLLNMRSNRGANRRAVARSTDGGLTWTKPVDDPALIEPVCQGSLIRLRHGGSTLLAFSNPASTKRERLTIRLSDDDGKTWAKQLTVFTGSAAYSCLTELKGGDIGLIFERDNYGRISFMRLTPQLVVK